LEEWKTKGRAKALIPRDFIEQQQQPPISELSENELAAKQRANEIWGKCREKYKIVEKTVFKKRQVSKTK